MGLMKEVLWDRVISSLSQFDIPKGAVVNPRKNHKDETLYISIMDTKNLCYFIKCHDHIHIQKFYLNDYKDEKELQFIELEKTMNL